MVNIITNKELSKKVWNKPSDFNLLFKYLYETDEHLLEISPKNQDDVAYTSKIIIPNDHMFSPFAHKLYDEIELLRANLATKERDLKDQKNSESSELEKAKTEINRLREQNRILDHDLRLTILETNKLKYVIKSLENPVDVEYAHVEGWDEF